MRNDHPGLFSSTDLVAPHWLAFNTSASKLLERCDLDELARLLKAGRLFVARLEDILRRRLDLPSGGEPLLLRGAASEAWVWRQAHRLARSYKTPADLASMRDCIHVLAERVEAMRMEKAAQEQEAAHGR